MAEVELKKQIGRNLQLARKAAGFKSAKAFAEHINLEVSRYTEYEQGRVAFSYETAWQLADALHCSLDELGGRQWPTPESSGSDSLTAEESKLIDDYRATHDYFKPEITHYADDQASRHPKNEPNGLPRQEVERTA